jgi:hypothetical protein
MSGDVFRRAPYLTYLHGAVDKPDVVVERKERKKKEKVRCSPRGSF